MRISERSFFVLLSVFGTDATVMMANGDITTAETQTTVINGYTCNECTMLSDRKDALTAYCTSNTASSTAVYSRDKSKKSSKMCFIVASSYISVFKLGEGGEKMLFKILKGNIFYLFIFIVDLNFGCLGKILYQVVEQKASLLGLSTLVAMTTTIPFEKTLEIH